MRTRLSLGVVLCLAGVVSASEIKLLASDGAASDFFGGNVAVSGDLAIVGASGDDDNGANSGSTYVYVRVGAAWNEETKLVASDGVAGDNFGRAVAIDGDTVVIGAAASAYIFVRSGTTWTQQAKLVALDGGFWGSGFGQSVSISGDTVLVGNWVDNVQTGSAYVFVRTGTTWTQQAKLIASDSTINALFGWTVSVSGETAVCSSDRDDDMGEKAGAVYVFVRNGTIWTQQAKLTAADGANLDFFGAYVSLSGETLLASSQNDDDNGTDSGSAYVFVRNGTTWTQQAKLTASDGALGDSLGWSLALSADTALIGANLDDDKGMNSGSAYVFVRSGATWSEEAKLTAPDGVEMGFFGRSVGVSGDVLISGASGHSDNGAFSGSAYVFDLTSPWADLGQALAGTNGDPLLVGEGTLVGGDPVALMLSGALENSPAALVVGLSGINAAFKGGVLVPAPDIVIAGLTTDPSGILALAAIWPVGVPSGFSTFYQYWITDVVGPAGFAASNAVSGTAP